MGAGASSLLSCGVLELLTGDPDYELTRGGITYSAARRARNNEALEQDVRDELLQREETCRKYEAEIATYTAEIAQCSRLARATNLAPAKKQAALTRGKRALQAMTQAQARLRTERVFVEKTQSVLARLNVAQSGDKNRVLMQKVATLAHGIEATDEKMNELEKAGEDMVEAHDHLGQFEDSLHSTVANLDRSISTGVAVEGTEFNLDDNEQLLAALAQVEEQQLDEPVYSSSTATNSTTMFPPAPTTDMPVYRPPAQYNTPGRVAVALTTSGQARDQRAVRRHHSDDVSDAF